VWRYYFQRLHGVSSLPPVTTVIGTSVNNYTRNSFAVRMDYLVLETELPNKLGYHLFT